VEQGYVKTRGRKDAPVMIICGPPSQYEVTNQKPLIGHVGNVLWKELKLVGIYPEDCYVTNICKVNPGKWPKGKKAADLMLAWADTLSKEMKAAKPRVVLLVGGEALQRVTSFTNIKDWRGSLLTGDDLPNTLVWHQTMKTSVAYPTELPPSNPHIIPTFDPAGVVASKGREAIVLFKRDLKKVAKILNDSWKPHRMVTHFRSSPGEIAKHLRGKKRVYFDTEFHPITKQIYWVGVSGDGVNVYGFPWVPAYYDVVKKVMENESVTKGAHNIVADMRVLNHAGIEIKGEMFCTMIGMYTLHPDQMVGLSPTSRFYIDDVKYHKWMEKDDPVYNAYDVSYGWGCWDGELAEARQRPVDPMPEMLSRFRLIPICAGMEDRGMPVDTGVQRKLKKEQRAVIKGLMQEVLEHVKPAWERRVRGVEEELFKRNKEFTALQTCYAGNCKKHPTYYPSKKPSATCSTCIELKDTMGEVFTEEYDKVKDLRSKLKGKMKRWEEGFNYKSSEHLTWFLYTESKLPIQRFKGRITSNATAIEKLSKLKSAMVKKEAFAAVMKMKEMQQASKALSTFLQVPLRKGVAHPPYKIHGTVTGRLAGGADKRGEMDKVDNTSAFNPLNIPKPWRQMYVPRPGFCLVGGDWKNQEGRLMAWMSDDHAYQAAFMIEDAGGVDVHSNNAGTVFGIDPADARTVKIRFNGQMYSARHCAKVANHAWSYSPTPVYTLQKNFQLEKKEALRIDSVLREARPGVVAYKEQIVREVLGAWSISSSGVAYCGIPGTRFYSNPFGWQVFFWGMGEVRVDPRTGKKVPLPAQAGELIAQGPQSTGASMFSACTYEVAQLGFTPYTGTYDSLVLEVRDDASARREAVDALKTVMERKWDELDGMSFPIDVEWGYNMGPHSDSNVGGLRSVE